MAPVRITKKMIEKCREEGACSGALRWASERPRTIHQLYSYNAEWGYWLQRILSNEAFLLYRKTCREEAVSYALSGKEARKRALISALKMDGWK